MKHLVSLKSKNIVITGASSGIGRQCAITCSQLGAHIILIARDVDRLRETHEALEEGRHLICAMDIGVFDRLESTISNAVEEIGKISGFVHSAGMEMTLPLRNLKATQIQQVMNINVVSAFELSRIISNKKYISEQGGSFVFLSSIMGVVGQIAKVGYCSSKGALIAGVKAMALELSAKNIRVNAISPAMVRTPMSSKLLDSLPESSKNEILKMHPLGLGEPEDVASAVAFLLCNAAKWITGTNLIIDGGYSAQ